jgi:hypothetical protein
MEVSAVFISSGSLREPLVTLKASELPPQAKIELEMGALRAGNFLQSSIHAIPLIRRAFCRVVTVVTLCTNIDAMFISQ